MKEQRQPWQFDWKGPRWRRPLDFVYHVPGRPLDHAAAAVSPSEIQAAGFESNPQASAASLDLNETDKNLPLLLSVTLICTPSFAPGKSRVADAVLLELTRTSMSDVDDSSKTDGGDSEGSDTGQDFECLQSRLLRWPAAVFNDLNLGDVIDEETETNDEDEDPAFQKSYSLPNYFAPWRRLKASSSASLGSTDSEARSRGRKGLVSAAFCRIPRTHDPDSKLHDTVDLMSLLSLGMPHQPAPHYKQQNKVEPDEPQESPLPPLLSVDDETHELYLALLSDSGTVFFYSPWLLLRDWSHPASPDQRWDQGMASLLFGSSLFSAVQETVLPLSQPLKTASLSVRMHQRLSRKENQTTLERVYKEQDALEPEPESPRLETPRNRPVTISPWDPSLWDSVIDPATLAYRTKSNVPTLCVAAWEYLCVAGKGHRGRRNLSDLRVHQVNEKTHHWSAVSSTVATEDTALDRFFDGGFVSLFSLRSFSEVRTLYLPFVPREVSPFHWGGMSFLLALGHHSHEASAIRVDSSDMTTVTSPFAGALSKDGPGPQSTSIETDPFKIMDSTEASAKVETNYSIRRFQMVPIDLPDTEDLTPLVVGPSMLTTPPSLTFVFVDEHNGEVSVLQRVLRGINVPQQDTTKATDGLTFVAMQAPSLTTDHLIPHTARISLPNDALSMEDTVPTREHLWCRAGQGWCVLGVSHYRYFICWEGATTPHGAFVTSLGHDESGLWSRQELLDHVLPVNPFRRAVGNHTPIVPELTLPFSGPSLGPAVLSDLYRPLSLTSNHGYEPRALLDDIVVKAIQSISSQNYRESISLASPPLSPRRLATSFTHTEKSARLLRHCSSWTQLEKSNVLKSHFGQQVPVLSARVMGPRSSGHAMMSIRKVVVDNGPASPFQQVLSWLLSQKEDYFGAASVALDLMCDSVSLRLLWRAFERIDEDDEREKLEGLLDGINPLRELVIGQEDAGALWTQLADMTVGCLTKGGYAMSSTLDHFLENDKHYDTARACLMLVATTTCLVSEDEEEANRSNGDTLVRLLWSVRCLLKAAVVRGSMVTALLLLNAAIPDELRHRPRAGIAASSVPSLSLCRALITLIISSSDDASELLLNLVDEQSRLLFWDSLTHQTKLELALIEIDQCYILIRQPEVRTWTLQQLQREIANASVPPSASFMVNSLSAHWLQRLAVSILKNAGCDSFFLCSISPETVSLCLSDDVENYTASICCCRDSLTAGPGSGGLDFDLIIPALLVLCHRDLDWEDWSLYSSQLVLNALCYLAGRPPEVELQFAPDISTLMRQCTLVNNVQAGANLVGGPSGIVLECCYALISELGMSMEVAESLLLAKVLRSDDCLESRPTSCSFRLGHKHILFLLESHVIDVATFGDFESNIRGRVDPVFAATVCLRSWFFLTRWKKRDGTEWLTDWLQRKLNLLTPSPRRLPCAAIVRALLWTENHHDRADAVLALRLELPNNFLVSLTQACVGLVESLPPLENETIWTTGISRKDNSFVSAHNMALNESTDESFVSATSSFLDFDS